MERRSTMKTISVSLASTGHTYRVSFRDDGHPMAVMRTDGRYHKAIKCSTKIAKEAVAAALGKPYYPQPKPVSKTYMHLAAGTRR
jgi:hypothetical protein